MKFDLKNIRLATVVILIAFIFSATEWHVDHDHDAKPSECQCCLQCCPSHNLAPLPDQMTSLIGQPIATEFVESINIVHQLLIPSKIDRPPIA
ncbi:MAG: hypothetical protein COV45_05160 [Deltaproteobacteria bacterium CG11_big_fil_rev_8_21_14_0_20_47_16]|nr:MAG: hypothetical protein COV45_05160 [Deltaproteobacteria bacterium CG11_big_fil_rev_8_21_14_0_20_47_16]